MELLLEHDNTSKTFQLRGVIVAYVIAIICTLFLYGMTMTINMLCKELKELQSFVRKVPMFIKDKEKVNEGEGLSLAEIRVILFQMDSY